MSELWYSKATVKQGNSGGAWVSGYPARGVLHTTEGSSASGAISAYTQNNSWPHFTVDKDGKVFQHVSVGVASRALRNLSGGVETNRSKAIQIEIVGFAGKPTEHSKEQLDALRNLMRWIETNTGVLPKAPAKPFATAYGQTGRRFTNAEWTAFDGWCGHSHVPENCVQIDTPILTSSLDWVRAGDLVVGDELFGFDEEPIEIGSTAGRRFKRSTVEFTNVFEAEGYKITTTQGDLITTEDHPWLVMDVTRKHGKRVKWVNSKDLDPSIHEVYFTSHPWEVETSHTAGWLAGVLDADGHTQSNRNAGAWVGFGQVHGPLLEEFIFEMEARNFTLKRYERGIGRGFGGKKPFTDVRVTGGLWEQLRVLGSLKPKRLSLDTAWEGAVVGKTCQRVQILSVEPVGIQTFAGLQISSKTYIANGFLNHNSHWDPGAIDLASLLTSPNIIVGTPVEVDVQLTPVQVNVNIDSNGKGWTRVPYQIDKIVGAKAHSGTRPGVDGVYDSVPDVVGLTPDDNTTGVGTIVVIQGGNPGGTAPVWFHVIA